MDHDVEPIKMAPPPSSSFATFDMSPAPLPPPTPSEPPPKSVSFSNFELQSQSRPPPQRPPPSIVFEPLKTVPHKQHFELGHGSGAYRPPPKSVSYAAVEIGDHPYPAPFHGPEPVHRPIPVHRPAPVHITVPPPVEGSHLEPAINHRPDIPSVHDFSSSISSAELNHNFESLFDSFDVSLFDIGDIGGGGGSDDNKVSFDADDAGFRDFGLDFGPVLHDVDHHHPHKDHYNVKDNYEVKDHYSYNNNHYDDHYHQHQHRPKDHYHYNPLPEKDYQPQLPHFQDYNRPPAMYNQHHAEQPTAMPPFLETGPFVVSGPAEYVPPAPHKPVIIQARFLTENFLEIVSIAS